MASYWDVGMKVPFIADEDLSAACAQWKLVAPASTGGYVKAVISACNPIAVGVLVNDPCAGQAAEVVIFGPTKAKCRVTTCDLKNGRYLKAASDGVFEALESDTTNFAFARYFGVTAAGTTDASVIANVFVYGMSSCGMQLGTS